MSVIHGIDTSELPNQWEAPNPQCTAILDGDGLCYRAAVGAVKFSTMMRHAQQEILKVMYLTGVEHCRVHLTAADSTKFRRFEVAAHKPYQGNRTGKAKPAMLESVRSGLLREEFTLPGVDVYLHRDWEADDAMMIDSYSFGESGIMYSEDKDLRMTPYPYWDISSGRILKTDHVGYVDLYHTATGNAKLIGHGPMFFWGQMLAGDTADNIKGVKAYQKALCGAVKTVDILGGIYDINTAANLVIDAYRVIKQNVLAEGWLLHLKRGMFDDVVVYFESLELSKSNAQFVQECKNTLWRSDGRADNPVTGAD